MFRNIDKTGLTYELDDETSWTRVMVCRFGIYIIINDCSCHSYSDNTPARNTCQWLPSNNIVVSYYNRLHVFICWIKSISLCSDTRLYLGERNSMICIIKNLLTLIRVSWGVIFARECVSKWCPDILLANTVIHEELTLGGTSQPQNPWKAHVIADTWTLGTSINRDTGLWRWSVLPRFLCSGMKT